MAKKDVADMSVEQKLKNVRQNQRKGINYQFPEYFALAHIHFKVFLHK